MDGTGKSRTDALRISGPVQLAGTVAVGGAKNAALPIMAASILADGVTELARVPRVTDVATLSHVLGHLGMQVNLDANHQIRIEPVDVSRCDAPVDLVRRMRASFCVLGPLLARRGLAVVPLPGGCNLGTRPVELHLKGLAALGADIRVSNGYVEARARRLRGANIDLRGRHGPTVTGTANVLCAATLAKGTTVITHAATEPEVVDLGRFLSTLGARIEGLGSSQLVIRGVDQLGSAAHRVIPDRIEAATLLIAAAATGGDVTACGTNARDMQAVVELLSAAGCDVTVRRPGAPRGTESIAIRRKGRLRAMRVVARPHPGVPSDVQPLLAALLARAEGTSHLQDTVFPARFDYATELRQLGARIEPNGSGMSIRGPAHLRAAPVVAHDLRGGASLVIAALVAQGETIIGGVEHIDRGYERLDYKLGCLGARIERFDRDQLGELSGVAGIEPETAATAS